MGNGVMLNSHPKGILKGDAAGAIDALQPTAALESAPDAVLELAAAAYLNAGQPADAGFATDDPSARLA